jgi:glycosyltransferase involved in cell wall biosynthesis
MTNDRPADPDARRLDLPGKALLVIGPEPPPYTGMEIATRALLDELDAAGWAYVRVDTADPHDELSGRGTWSLHNVRKALVDLRAAAGLCLFSRRVRAMYIPIAQEFPGLYRDLAFVAVAIATRRPFIIHLHGGSFCEFFRAQSFFVRRAIRALIGRAALGIVLTERLRPALSCALSEQRIVVVPNGVDLGAPSSPAPPEGDGGAVRLLFFSSLLPSKGSLVFLEALALVRRSHQNVVATVAGTWPSPEIKAATIEHARSLGISDVVSFVGAVFGSAKADVFSQADVFCLPSYYAQEGQPLVVLEAMSAGLPVVATAWRGIADTVVDGETGFLVGAADPDAVASKLIPLLDDPELRRRMGEEGRRRYENQYTQKAFGARMLQVLEPWSSQASGTHRALVEEPAPRP